MTLPKSQTKSDSYTNLFDTSQTSDQQSPQQRTTMSVGATFNSNQNNHYQPQVSPRSGQRKNFYERQSPQRGRRGDRGAPMATPEESFITQMSSEPPPRHLLNSPGSGRTNDSRSYMQNSHSHMNDSGYRSVEAKAPVRGRGREGNTYAMSSSQSYPQQLRTSQPEPQQAPQAPRSQSQYRPYMSNSSERLEDPPTERIRGRRERGATDQRQGNIRQHSHDRYNSSENRTKRSYEALPSRSYSATPPSTSKSMTLPSHSADVFDDLGDRPNGRRPMSFVKALEMSEYVEQKQPRTTPPQHKSNTLSSASHLPPQGRPPAGQGRRGREERKKPPHDSNFEVSV